MDFRKIHKYQISCKSVQWKSSCSMRTDGRTHMTNLTVASCNFANAPKYDIHSVYNQYDTSYVVWMSKDKRCNVSGAP
jgi:hypothetical protein